MKNKFYDLRMGNRTGGLLLALIFFLSSVAMAQAQNLRGKVSGSDGEPLIGAAVTIVGTTRGASTDGSGNYAIDVKNNETLRFSSVGFISKDVVYSGQKTLNISLAADNKTLNEIIVVGYGSQVKKEITGAVQTISYKELKDLPVTQIGQKLQGQLAGVQINQTTGQPGKGMNIRIRGQLSVSAGSDPLYVVDGFPITGSIGAMNPDEIEDISVLKDASSTSLYGSRAANGVVLITTKKGKGAGMNVSFSAFTGVQNVPMKGRLDMMDAEEFAQFKKESFEDAKQPVPAEFQNPAQYKGKNNDWYDALLNKDAPISSYTLSITSNKERARTSLVAGVLQQKGVVRNTDYQRYSLRLNSTYDISDKVTIGFNVAPQMVYDNTPRTDGDRGTGILFNALHTWPIMPIYEADGKTLTKFNRFPASTGNIFAYANWVRSADELINETTTTNLLSNAFVEFEPIKGLKFKSSMNGEILRTKFFFFNPSNATSAINTPIPTTAVSIRENFENLSWLNENTVTYNKTINEDHKVELLGGYTNQYFRQESTRIQADTYADDRLPTIQGAINIARGGTNSGVQEWSLTSYLARLNYNYKGKYLFNAAIRSDGSSRFGANNRWGTFPSVGAGWVVSDEAFMSELPVVSFMKLRGSWGIIGNNNLGNYTSYALINNTVNGVFGNTVATGAAVSSLANPNLGWETTQQLDLGLDLNLFNNRINFAYDYYTKNTTNLLYAVQIAQESGFGNFNDNIGEIKFWGHEFSLNTTNTTGKVKWTTNANISFNRNVVVALAPGIDRVYGSFHITKVGQPFGQFYGVIADGVYKNAADLANSPKVPGRSTVGSIKLKDFNGNGVIDYGGNADDRTIMGNPFPDFVYGITNNVTYQNWDFNIIGSGSYGNQLLVRHIYSTANLDGVFNMVDGAKYRFRSEANPGMGMYGTTVGGGNVTGIERDWMNSRFVADASYFTIRNITLGYTFAKPTKVYKSVRVYASCQQAYVFTNYWGGPNPETSAQGNGQGDGGNLSPGVDLSNYPVPRTFTVGANFNF
ncbi:SusC/RagA family TonB-linked outer membrane protein [Aquirufa ecclesiirivi]|uniref:SusC/RagA family TonB-linked outer membrane protein n=1 Tax=Aquirufa ecclesiirivi TaxID=2715124 RepID=UPI0014075F43|nr:TonB-dependent receptor [Aquirufa ecclesiirivi]